MDIKNLYFFFEKDLNNITYSIDMLRLKTYISYLQYSELEFYLNAYYKDNIKRFWMSNRPMCFHYNYNIEISEGVSFYFSFMHNSETIRFDKTNKLYNFTIEFNPNKLKDNPLVIYILSHYYNWYLRSFDLAMDINIGINDIFFDIGNRRKLNTISYAKDDITYVIGSGSGRVKIYNKKKESNLSITGHLTRIEISCDYDDFPISDIIFFNFNECYFPHVYLNQYLQSLDDICSKDSTLSAILFAVQHGYPMKNLSRRYKEKIHNLLEGSSYIKFDKNIVNNIFKGCILKYFKNTKQLIK